MKQNIHNVERIVRVVSAVSAAGHFNLQGQAEVSGGEKPNVNFRAGISL